MLYYLFIGTVLGLSAGFAPGPLLTLVISETLLHDIKSGIKVACAPIITDLPIVLLTVFVLAKLSNFHFVLGVISLSGGVYIIIMGFESLRTKGRVIGLQEVEQKSLLKGIVVNFLSPHPYLFWLSVGAPIMAKAININIIALIAFLVSFYFFLVGSKILLAILVGKSKSFLSGPVYIYTMRFLGVVLIALALVLFRDGLKLLGIMN
jgi:threonine/homoserine/homoserine lactone efflux protein